MACFASLGEEVKVWDAVNHSLQEHFSLDRDDVTDICWNHDGLVLASCKKDNFVDLRQFNGSKSISSHSFALPEAHSLCIEYDSSSRYLACGCNNGALYIFDTNSMKIHKSYERHRFPVTSVRWNWNDKNVALGSKHGEVFLYNVITGQASSPFKPVSSVAIQQLRYNPYRKASLVSADAMGVITLWDTNTRGHVHSFSSSHQAPASDLAFSPVNDYLMLSVGLDKRLIFYDVQNKKAINTITTEYPLTSVDMQDAGTIAVGTSRGKILFYDMRMSSTAMSTIHAHKSSVKRIIFNKKDEVIASSSSLQPMPSEHSHYYNEQNENQNQNEEWKVISTASDKMSTGVISPLRDGSDISGLSESNLSALRNQHSFINQVLGHNDDSSSRKVNSSRPESAKNSLVSSGLHGSHSGVPNESAAVAGLFSPCHDSSSLTNSNLSISYLNKHNGSFLTQILGAAGSRETSKDQGVVQEEDEMSFKAISNGPPGSSFLMDRSDVNFTDALPSSGVKSKSQTTHRNSLHRTPPKNSLKNSPPRNSSHRGIGASPSLHDVTSPEQHAAVGGSPVLNSNHFPSHPANGSHSSTPERKSSTKTVCGVSDSVVDQCDVEGVFTSPRSSTRHRSNSKTKANMESLEGVVTDLRQMFKTLMKEHMAAAVDTMKAEMKADIKAMMGQRSGAGSFGVGSNSLLASVPEGIPSQGDMIRQIVREELQDVKDKIHEEAVQSLVANHKMYFKLQMAMQQGFSELAINPALLDEIERLKREVERLKSLY